MNEKKVVHYTSAERIEVGSSAFVVPTDHESPRVINGQPAITTVVENYDKATGVFETRNTIYKPAMILG